MYTPAEFAITSRAQELYKQQHPDFVDGESEVNTSSLCKAFFQAVDEHYAPPHEDVLLASATEVSPGSFEVKGDAALAWLKLAHGVVPGDAILVHGWKRPREILVESLCLTKSKGEGNHWWMWFTGPCKTPEGALRATSGTMASERVQKQAAPSRALSYFIEDERAAGKS